MAEAMTDIASDTPVEWRRFLTDYPPGTYALVKNATKPRTPNSDAVVLPELELTCTRTCQGDRFCTGRPEGSIGSIFATFFPADGLINVHDRLVTYTCDDCRQPVKAYGIRIGQREDDPEKQVLAIKMSEWPEFTFRTPSKVISLVGPDRDLFLKGRRAESLGLGVGAFAYYRRIVEDQKGRLLNEIIKVARRVNAPGDAITKLEAAKNETQFNKAVDMVRDAVPPVLLIKGRNPLTLLHSALSRNLHSASDEECLRVAHDIRVILFELAERLGQALKDERELNEAVSRLLNPGS